MIEAFKELIETENCMEKFFNNYTNEKVVLFGAGFSMYKLLDKLLEQNINIVAICDNNENKYGQKITNKLEVISFNESINLYPNAIYIISSHDYFWEIYNSLTKTLPKNQVCSIDFECAHYFYGYKFKKYFIDNINDFEKIYNLFSDDESKKLFIQVLKAHFTGERKEFDKAFSGKEDWYLFNNLLKPESDSIYIDCGAYDGDTILLFNKAAVNGYKKIIALEPDPDIQEKLKNNITNNDIKNIDILKIGAFNTCTNLYFEQNGVYSNITTEEKINLSPKTIEIKVDCIDNIINNEKVDIIKMDIEGAEYFALDGAKETILKNKPKLAICLYHNYEDFLRIPLLIHEMNNNYKFYLKHQSSGCTDTILFAVDNKN